MMDNWEQGVAALEAADAEEFLSEGYMSHSEEAAQFFEAAAKELAESDPEMAAKAADITARLRRFLSIDWGNPADVETTNDEVEGGAEDALIASGGPSLSSPPVEWFKDPHLAGPTPLTITKDGRVYGHIALWGTCHTGHSQHGRCVTPPRSHTNYAHFRTGAVLTAEGIEVPVGHITIDTKHANTRLNAIRAAAHYDHTGHSVADVAVGEDSHGIWFSGALRPGLTDKTLRAFRAAPLSGDWRNVGGNLELVAALGVNMPGFPVPRPQGLVASGVQQSLVASGMVPPANISPTETSLSAEDLKYLQRLAQRERAEEAEQVAGAAASLASRVRATTAERRVRQFAATRKESRGE